MESNQKLKPTEVTRSNDIATGDACLSQIRCGAYRNPIEMWCESEPFVEKYGVEDAKMMCSWAKAKAPLDPRKDEMLPDWAIDVLRLGRLGYKARIKIVMTHAEDILRYKMLKNRKDIV